MNRHPFELDTLARSRMDDLRRAGRRPQSGGDPGGPTGAVRPGPGALGRVRRGTGHALIAAGRRLAGPEPLVARVAGPGGARLG